MTDVRERAGKNRGDPTYGSWVRMRRRMRPTDPSYKNYGARGITICERWSDFYAFLADMGPRPKGTSLDRIDNDGNYAPGNCRWATPAEQTRNRRVTHQITIDGECLSAGEWARRFNVWSQSINRRIRLGMDPVEAVRKTIDCAERARAR